MGLLPYHASALDCQNPTRGDARTICRDPLLKAAEERRIVLYERMAGAMASEERAGFTAYENGWVNGRNARCPLRGDEVDRNCLREVIDDHIAELEALDGRSAGLSGRLRFRYRKSAAINPNIDIHATYVEFESPRTAAERLLNEQVAQLIHRLPFAKAVDPKSTNTWQDTIDVRAIYRSPRLIAVKFAMWLCCGAHGSGGFYTVNIDVEAGTVLVPDRWFRLDEVAAACWYQFVDGEKGGEAFRRQYPLRDAIERFSEDLRRPSIWTFSRQGAELQFSTLMGYAGGTFTCRLGYPELTKAAVSGLKLPP
jgi:uncharacterized protein